MMIALLAATALAAQAPADQPQKIEFGHAKWDKLPKLERGGQPLPYVDMIEVAELALDEEKCRIEGQSARRFDIEIPYAVFLGPDGKAERVLVEDMGCEPLQNMVGELAYQLSGLGDFRTGSAGANRWYADTINLTLE